MRRRLERVLPGPVEIWPYDSSGRTCIAELGSKLAAEVGVDEVNLVGYSMGGLVVRAAALVDPRLRIRRAVFLHSPHRGSFVAWALPLPACRDMRPGSAFLRRLDNAPWHIPAMATWCWADLMVFPGASARWTRATVIRHKLQPAHVWPIYSPSLQSEVAGFLADNAV